MTLAVAGVTKTLEEKFLAGIVGNATVLSGVIKLGIGMMIPSIAGKSKVAQGISLGFGIDGIEDILTSVMGGIGSTTTGGVL